MTLLEAVRDRVRVIYILGLTHSGSTLLDLMLNAHSSVVTGGEIKQLHWRINARGINSDKRFCACGALRLEDCAFWSGVAFALRQDAGVDIYDVGTDPNDGAGFTATNAALLAAMQRVAHALVIVDSSKDVSRFRELLNLPGVEVIPVLIIRGAKGQIASSLRKQYAPLGQLIQTYNRKMRQMLQLLGSKPHFTVRYETLVRSPEQTMEHLMTNIGFEFEPTQLQWANAEHHNCGGNRLRFATSNEIKPSNDWRLRLSLIQQWQIDLGTLPSRVALALHQWRHLRRKRQ